MVMPSVPVKVPKTCEVAVTVTTPLLVVGTVDGAVYRPPLVMVPLPVPLTLQFTRVLVSFVTVAVHWDTPSTVTLVGEQETVIVGVEVVLALEPHELSTAGSAKNPRMKSRRCQRNWWHSNGNFGSNTRNPPAHATMIFLRKLPVLYQLLRYKFRTV